MGARTTYFAFFTLLFFSRSLFAQPVRQTRFGKLPLAFAVGPGERDSPVSYWTRTGGYTLCLSAAGVVIQPRDGNRSVRIAFPGSRPAVPVAEEQVPGVVNYFVGNDPKRWRRDVPTYQRVLYRNLYPGIDLVFYGNQQHLEFDLVAAPGADPRAVRMRITGSRRMRIENFGDLVWESAGGKFQLHKPVVYQQSGETRRGVAAKFVRRGRHDFGFAFGAYDPGLPLVVDPILAYSTFLGGSSGSYGQDIARDAQGNVYITGATISTDFPTIPPLAGPIGAGANAFVTKLNAEGTAMIYSSVFGGGKDDGALGIAVDPAGNAYVTGSTFSTDFPIVGGFQPQLVVSGGTGDAFVVKLNAQGAIAYSSYLGGGGDVGRRIAVDSAGSAYVTGDTQSKVFPLQNAFQSAPGKTGIPPFNTHTGFLTKVNAAGSALVYSTYLGGSGDDIAFGVALDGFGNAYVTGYTSSPDFPTTSGSFQPVKKAGAYNAFVTKFNSAGTQLAYSTYLGGASADFGWAIALDAVGSVYISGGTQSNDFPTLPPQSVTVRASAFVSKINPSGSALVYSKVFGGSIGASAYAVAVDGGGNAYVTGQAESPDFPVINGLQLMPGGCVGQVGLGPLASVFVAKIDPAGSFVYSAPLGGGCRDTSGHGIAVDASGSAYVTGGTSWPAFPTVNALQTTFEGSDSDAFVAKLSDGALPAPAILANGIVNGASFRAATDANGAIAPGAIVSIFGSNLAGAALSAAILPLPTNLFGASVTFNGVAAPLFYVSGTQINAQVPFLTSSGSVTVKVQHIDQTSTTQSVQVAAVSPGIFFSTTPGSGTATGAVLHAQSFAPVTAQAPAAAGEFISIFATGLGPLQQPVAEGTAPPIPPPMTATQPTVTVGGQNAVVSYSGLAPLFAGVYQVNVQVPSGLTSGAQPLQITIGGVPSNTVTTYVK